jgi:hypothetical protein
MPVRACTGMMRFLRQQPGLPGLNPGTPACIAANPAATGVTPAVIHSSGYKAFAGRRRTVITMVLHAGANTGWLAHKLYAIAGGMRGMAMSRRWLQIRGDPAIRRFLFKQSRIDNEFDSRLDEVLGRVQQLLAGRGIFHAKVHFSSGQVTLWRFSDPYNYNVYLKDEFLKRGFMRSFKAAPYPINAAVPPHRIPLVLDILRLLRCSDDAVYLRSGSLNIINGLVGLNFSCDGSHYIDYRDFLEQRNVLYECSMP